MVHTIATITGDGATHPIQATSQKATWIQFQAPDTNSAPARVGDSLTSATRGATVPASGFQFMPTSGNANIYDLSTTYYYLANGDKLDIVYSTF